MTIAAIESHADPGSNRRPSSAFANTDARGSTTTRAERLFPMVVALYLTLVFATGGGSQDAGFDDAVVQGLALPLVAFATWRLLVGGMPRGSRWPLAIACAIVALPLLQLLPV